MNRGSNPVDNEGEPIAQASLLATLPSNSPGNGVTWESATCAWSSDGRYFAWSCSHRLIKIVLQKRTTTSGKKSTEENDDANAVVTIDAGEKVCCMTFGCRNTRVRRQSNLTTFRYLVVDDVILATGLRNGRIRTWDVKTGCLKLELIDHTGIISDLSFAPDGSLRLVSASHDSTLKVWDLEDDGNLTKTIKSKAKVVFGCRWSPDSKMLASVGDRKTVELWNMDTYTLIRRFDGHQHTVSMCDFSPDGALLATSSHDSRVIVWDVVRAVPVIELFHLLPAPSLIFAGGANGAYVRNISFSTDGKHIGTVCEDGLARFWDIFEPDFPVRVASVDDASCCRFSPGGASLAVITAKGKALIYESPKRVTSLQRICRLTIRRFLCPDKVDELWMIPKIIQSFLKYENL